MFPYVIMFFLFSGLCLLAAYIAKREVFISTVHASVNLPSWILLLPSLSILVFFSTFRSMSVGRDLGNYERHFYEIADGEHLTWDIGYIWYNKFIGLFTDSFNIFIIITSILILIITYYAILKLSVDPVLSLFFYLTTFTYFMHYSAVRQAIAMAILLLAYVALVKGKYIKALLLGCIAATFHYTAIIVVIVAILFYRRYTIKVWICTFALLIVSIPISSQIRKYVISNFMNSSNGFYESTPLAYNKPMLFYYTLLLLFILLYYDTIMQKAQNTFLVNVVFITFLFNLFMPWIPNHARITNYFTMFTVFLIPEIILAAKDKHTQIVYTAFFVTVLSAYWFYTLIFWSDSIKPYVFIFN